MKAIIVIPTYNEKGNIEKIVAVLEKEVFPKVSNWEIGILVVDDTSPDGTGEAVRGLMKDYKNLHLLVGSKQGLGAAYIRGMEYAIEKLDADVVFEMDADFFHDPHKVPQFLKKIDEGYDFVIGTRYSGGGAIPSNWALKRKLYSILGNLLVRTIFMRFSIHDWTGGYRAIKKEVFLKEKHKLSIFKGYRFQVGFLHKAVQDGFKVAEVPFQATDRTMGKSKMEGAETIIDTLQYVFLARIKELDRVIKFLVVGGAGFILQFILTFICIQLHMAQFIATMIGAEGAILSNFFLNNMWTFQDTKHIKEQGGVVTRLVKFNVASLSSIVIQGVVSFIAVKLLGDYVHLLGHALHTSLVILFPTIILIVIPLNYFIYNRLIWKTHHLKKQK